jgi:hypothetical protein
MKNNTDIVISPEFKKFLDLHEELKEELTKLITDRDTLISTVKTNLEMEYQLKVGGKQYELFLIRTESLRLKRKMEMLQAILNRQGSCSMQEIDEQLDQEFAEWQKQAEEIYQQIKKAEYFADLPKLSVKEAVELKKLYRELAKKFHPDVNPHEWDERKNFWLRIKDAYQNGDLQEMKTLALLANDFQDQNPEISTMDKLRDDCADLKKRIQELINQIAHVKSQFPFDIEEQLQDEEWVTKQKEEIDIQIDEWQNTKSLYEEKVEELICQINPPQFH